MAEQARSETTVDLLRHGEPVGGNRYRGQLDDPLSERGWEQMWRAVEGRTDWQQIVTSPLQRCRAFATALGERADIPVRVDPRFAEVGFGSWEGRSRTELERLDPGQVSRFLTDPVGQRPLGAEPLDDFIGRVSSGFAGVLEHHAGQSVLLVAHAGVIRAVLSTILAMPPGVMYRIHVANAAITRVRTDRQRGYALLAHGSL